MSLSYFPDTQTLTMQQEALKRVRDMQLRARQSVEQSNTFPEASFQQAIPMQPSGSPVQPQFQMPPSYQTPFQTQQFQQTGAPQQAPPGRLPQQNMPQQNMPLQSNMPQGFPQQNNMPQGGIQQGPQQQVTPQGNMRQGTQRQSSPAQPNNILAHLFGGSRQSGAQNQNSGGQRNASQSTNQSTSRPGAAGLLDMLRKQGLGDSVSGLGETLQSTISSVSEPISGLLDSFGIDGEKLVILLVMWAIFNEHKDNKMLLMALGYLLL